MAPSFAFYVHGYEIFREGWHVGYKKHTYTYKHAHTCTYIHTHTRRPRPHLINALHEHAEHISPQRHAALKWLNQQTLDAGWRRPCCLRLHIFRCIHINVRIYIYTYIYLYINTYIHIHKHPKNKHRRSEQKTNMHVCFSIKTSINKICMYV